MSDIKSAQTTQNSVHNYINYYLLNADLDSIFKEEKYSIIFWIEVVVILGSLLVFYLPIIEQIIGYYFLSPSLTKENLDTMTNEREILSSYSNIKAKYIFTCTLSNTLAFKNLETNEITEALTLSGQTINNCSSLSL